MVLPLAVVIGGLAGGGRLHMGGSDGLLLFFLGTLLEVNLSQLFLLAATRPAGLAVVWSSVGVGRRLGSTVRGGRLVTFRSLPLILCYACVVVTERAEQGLRLWRATVLAVLAELAVAAALILSGGAAAPLGWGMATWSVLFGVIKPGTVTSRAWTLFRLPFGGRVSDLAEWAHDPVSLAAARALAAGRIDVMRAALAGAEPSRRPQRRAMEAALALAEGRYDDAARESWALRTELESRRLRLDALRTFAATLACAMEAGHWAPQDALPRFNAAMAELRDEQGPQLRVNGLAALAALFEGNPSQAEKKAAYAVRMAPDSSTLTEAHLTRAAAQSALGRHDAARASLAKAAALAPGLRRVAVVAAVISGTPVRVPAG
ncbi:hypothetical protein ACFO3J_14325 [Streptomyces polygonati]|uniref:Tetratricopeptide repeat protein n=1 Tax=Streptomyces polygonati TaxID=1617087 RepID=A0ABV8HRZ5_9ACTN